MCKQLLHGISEMEIALQRPVLRFGSIKIDVAGLMNEGKL